MRPACHRILSACLLAMMVVPALLPPAAAADSLVRGNMFTVTIAGRPNASYYVWFTRTSTMSGEYGDQPPLILDDSERVELDPDGGPYLIGSYQYNNGNGRTIRDDVAPSSSSVSDTRYYAKIRTDPDGIGIVRFTTSAATAARTFPIRAENPAAPGEDVYVALGLPDPVTLVRTPAPAVPFPAVPVTMPPTTPPPDTPATRPVPATVPASPVGAENLPAATVPGTTTYQAPAGPAVVLLAVGPALFLKRRLT